MNAANLPLDLFGLHGRVAIITGGGGMLGYQHAAAIAGFGGIPVLLDIDEHALAANARARCSRSSGLRSVR